MKALTITLSALTLSLVSAKDKQDPPKKREMKDRAWIEGTIVCVGCHLQSLDGGADSQCTLHSKHAQGLLKEDGTLWTFVDNERGHHAIVEKSLRDQAVRVYGWTFPTSQYVELYKYQRKQEDAWVTWDYCKT